MEDSNPEDVVFLSRSSRSTRGKRLTKLLDKEIEGDQAFWNQDALKEDDNDENYVEEREVVDVFDSDFDDYEQDQVEEAENDPHDRIQKKKVHRLRGRPAGRKKKNKTNKPQEQDKIENNDVSSDHHDSTNKIEEKVLRKSTRTSVIVRQAEREAIRATLRSTVKPIKRKKQGLEKRMTQEQMLLEAAQTEIMNLKNLERVLAREEELKKRAVTSKPVHSGPLIGFLSKDGSSYIEFKNGASFQSEIKTTTHPYPEKALCAVTGAPAKYRDPKTGLAYVTKEAFKIIRECDKKKRESGKEVEMGGSLLKMMIGFSRKRKRSSVCNKDEAKPHCRILSKLFHSTVQHF